MGIEKEQAIASVMRFRGLEHRLERVESPDDCLYINDSKSTNLSSLIWALQQSFQTSRGISQKIILIAGGKNKGGDFSAVRNLIKEKTKHVILIGESRDEIAACFEPSLSVEKASSLEEAIQKARAQALSSDVILFSPACASFDMFINYQDRGRQYKELVRNLTSFCPKTVSASS